MLPRISFPREDMFRIPPKTLLFFALGMTLTLFAAAFVQTAERYAGKRFLAIKKIDDLVRTGDPSSVDSRNEGHIVRLTGLATTNKVLKDTLFGVEQQALLLERKVETFQWVEQSRDGKWWYEGRWSENLVDGGLFAEPEGHENPADHRFPGIVTIATEVTLGEFVVPGALISNLPNRDPVAIPSLDELSPGLRQDAILSSDAVFFGEDPDRPEIGDTRVSFEVIHPVGVHLLGVQRGRTFEHFGGASGPRYLAMKLDSTALFPNIDRLSPIQIWASRAIAMIALAAGLLLLRLAIPAGPRPSPIVAVLLSWAGGAVVAAETWWHFSPFHASMAAVLALTSLALALCVYRRSMPTVGIGATHRELDCKK